MKGHLNCFMGGLFCVTIVSIRSLTLYNCVWRTL